MTTTPLLEFTVPGKPMAKQRVRFTQAGHAYTPEKTLNYEALIMQCCVTAMEAVKISAPYAGPLSIIVTIMMPIPKSWSKSDQLSAELGQLRPTGRPDADNCAKTIMDALNNVAWIDDGQIVSLHATKWYDVRPRMEVRLDTIL